MKRTFFFIALLILASAIQLSSATVKENSESAECIKCHKKLYKKVLAGPYQHSVAINKCIACHIAQGIEEEIREEREKEKKVSMDFPAYQKKGVFYLDELQDDKKYAMELIVTDNAERNSKAYHLNVIPGKEIEYGDEIFSLKQLYRVTLEEVKKGVFVEATISWLTDVPATSEVEYKLLHGRWDKIELEDQFTKKHKVTLTGLKHRHNYLYRVISRDFKGNILQSEEYELNSSKDFTENAVNVREDPVHPVIKEAEAFRIKGRNGVYLRVHANKSSKLSVSLEEIMAAPEIIKVREEGSTNKNHSPGLAPSRYSTIDACKKCHYQNASHPVGIRGNNEKIRTPRDLPTIDNGIVTCVTCHFPHGGKKIYFARMDFKKDICIKCHIGGY